MNSCHHHRPHHPDDYLPNAAPMISVTGQLQAINDHSCFNVELILISTKCRRETFFYQAHLRLGRVEMYDQKIMNYVFNF